MTSSSSSKKYDFTDRVALVTGSSSGIGAAIAIQLASYGCKVVLTGRSASALQEVAQKVIKVSPTGSSSAAPPLTIVSDLLDDGAPKRLISETIAKFGKLNFLVNNAGGTTAKGDLASSNLMQEFDSVMRLNLRSVVELTALAVPYLEATSGAIVNISSVAGTMPFGIVYSSSKAALDMATKASALELGPKLIRVNSIQPGPIVTQIGRSAGLSQAGSDAVYNALTPLMLMKRIGQAEDIAHLTSFLLSDDARNITGSIMVSDSGALLKFPDINPEKLFNIAKEGSN
ncbi:Peroxisomal 2,4-dienoyl-CoA reductase [Tyrophagus putrescentiae]|nr:Peroxisomal 2,4-dienoyl-CoA reductase [Tyrophagus putrescentiae]